MREISISWDIEPIDFMKPLWIYVNHNGWWNNNSWLDVDNFFLDQEREISWRLFCDDVMCFCRQYVVGYKVCLILFQLKFKIMKVFLNKSRVNLRQFTATKINFYHIPTPCHFDPHQLDKTFSTEARKQSNIISENILSISLTRAKICNLLIGRLSRIVIFSYINCFYMRKALNDVKRIVSYFINFMGENSSIDSYKCHLHSHARNSSLYATYFISRK